MRVLHAVYVAAERQIAVCVVELDDFKFAARDYQSAHARGQRYFGFVGAVHTDDARQRRFFAVGHVYAVRREFGRGLRNSFEFFHIDIVCPTARG